MTIYRMSFHVGNHGPDMFPECQRLGIAAITYGPLAKTDLTTYSRMNKPDRWPLLSSPSQKSSLAHVAFDMTGGDIIYVKDRQRIINRGIVLGKHGHRAYRFDSSLTLRDPYGTPWPHQVPVNWLSDISPTRLLLNAEMNAVLKLGPDRIAMLEANFGRTKATFLDKNRQDALAEAGYYRETAQSLKFISRAHNGLSNRFKTWLRKRHHAAAIQEKDRIDIVFSIEGESAIAELKICFGASTRHAIREAIGQLLEYNHYPTRSEFVRWFVILDSVPSRDDRRYIGVLRETRGLPLVLGWQNGDEDFSFHPDWS